MADRTVSVRLQAVIGPYQAAMAEASAATRGLARDVGGLNRKTQAELQKLGVVGLAVGGGLAFGFGKAVSAAMSFDKVISNVGAVSDATSDQLRQLRDAALDAGKATVFSASESAQAEAELARAGVSVSDILGGGLRGSLDLAAAGQLEVADAATIAATAMVQFGKSGSAVPHIADLLAAAANKAQGDVRDMALALNYVGPIAAQMGVSLEETAGTIALLAHHGVLGERAGTGLRGMLTALTSPSKMAAGEMKKLGISVYEANGQFAGFEGVAAQLHDRMAGLTVAERDNALGRIFGNEQILAARLLYAGGADAVAEWTRNVNDAGAASRIAGRNLDNLAGDLEQLRGSIETALIEGGSEATGALRFLVQGATDTVNAFASLPGPLQGGVMALGAVAGAAALVGGAAIVAVPQIHAFNLALLELATNPATSAATTAGLSGLSAGIRGVGLSLGYLVPIAGTAFATFQILNATIGPDSSIGDSFDRMSSAFAGTAGALDDTTRAAMAAHLETLGMTEAFAAGGATIDGLYEASKRGMLGVSEFSSEMYKAGLISKADVQHLGGFVNALKEGTAKGSALQAVLGDTSKRLNDVGEGALGAAAGLEELNQQLDVDDATGSLRESMQGLADDFATGRQEGESFAAFQDRMSSSFVSVVRNIDQVRAALTASGQLSEDGAAQNAFMAQSLQLVARQFPGLRTQVDSYLERLGLIPKDVHTRATLDVSQALAALNALNRSISSSYAAMGAMSKFRAANRYMNATDQDTNDSVVTPLVGQVFGAPPVGSAGGGGGKSAADAAKDAAAKKAVENAQVLENMYKAGIVSAARYEASLDAQMAKLRPWTDEWVTLHEKRAQVAKDAADRVAKVQDVQFAEGRVSADRYIAILEDRHAREVKQHGYDTAEAASYRDKILDIQRDQLSKQQAMEDNQYEAGRMGWAEYRALLVERFNEQMELYGYWSDQAQAIYNQIVDIERDSTQKLTEEAEKAAKVRDDAFDKLNRHLDEEQGLRAQLERSADEHRKRMADIESKFVADSNAALAARREALVSWTSITERYVAGWGNSVSALARNVRSQLDAFSEWALALAEARSRGVSEAVIQMLGLDEGPQALAQLRMFGSATQAQIDELNAAIAERQKQAGDQTTAEASDSMSKLGAQLMTMAEAHAAAVEAQTEQFLADQRSLNEQLAKVGLDGGRSFGDAIAQGLMSSIPAIQQAARAAQAAMGAAGGGGTSGSVQVGGQTIGTGVQGIGSTGGQGGTLTGGQFVGGVLVPGTGIYTMPDGSIRMYAEGTSSVPADGPAYLHAGERVLSAVDNRQLVSAMQGMSSPPIVHNHIYVDIDGDKFQPAVRRAIRNMNTNAAISGSR